MPLELFKIFVLVIDALKSAKNTIRIRGVSRLNHHTSVITQGDCATDICTNIIAVNNNVAGVI